MPEQNEPRQRSFEPTQTMVEKAERIASLLLEPFERGLVNTESVEKATSRAQESQRLAGSVPLEDVLNSMRTMANDVAFYERHRRMPCYETKDGFAPLSVKAFDIEAARLEEGRSFGKESIRDASYYRGVLDAFDHIGQSLGLHGYGWTMRADRFHSVVFRGLCRFLAWRIAGFSDWISKRTGIMAGRDRFMRQDVPGQFVRAHKHGTMRVEVSCKTAGLRILSSPAYFIDWTYFGAPSSPVEHFLPPGRYIFGTQDGDIRGRIVDPVVFPIPDAFKPTLRAF